FREYLANGSSYDVLFGVKMFVFESTTRQILQNGAITSGSRVMTWQKFSKWRPNISRTVQATTFVLDAKCSFFLSDLRCLNYELKFEPG
uniref:hypothetical protein n=1 Tax=Bartonella sp. TT110JLCBS TaxID=3243578 RepID=UPI0035D0637A